MPMSPDSDTASSKPGRGLPSSLIIRSGKFVWTSLWHMMMSKLAPRDATGAYIRPVSQFRQTIAATTETKTKIKSPSAKTFVIVTAIISVEQGNPKSRLRLRPSPSQRPSPRQRLFLRLRLPFTYYCLLRFVSTCHLRKACYCTR